MGAFPLLRDELGVMTGYHSAQVEVAVRLNTNESPLPPPPAFLDQLAEAVAALPMHRYPDRTCGALRTALARLHGLRPEQVFVGNGSNEVLQCLLLAYGGAGRTAAVFEPTYAMHSTIARMTGTAVATGERSDDFTLPINEARRVLAEASPSVTFLCSPNNPTGRGEPKDVVGEVLDTAPGLVVVDEAYAQFAALWEKAALPYHVDAVKQAAGRLALRFTDEMEDRVALLVAERERIAAAVARLDVDTWPSDANFLLFRPRGRPGREVWQALVERSVLVRDCSSWPRLAGCLRVTVGSPGENDAFLNALEAVL